MESAIEIRHYINRAGKVVFDDWLSRVADARARAKIAIRIDRLAAGNFGDCKPLRQGLCELRIDWGPAIASIIRWSARFACCFSAAETNENSRQTLTGHWGT